MGEMLYSERLTLEAKIWGDSAEKQTRIAAPEWKYQRVLRHNIITHAPSIDTFLNYVRPGFKVLELACGSGWLTLAAAQQGAIAHGIDIADQAIEVARSYYATVKEEVSGSVSFEVADLNTIDLPEGYYDIVMAKGIFHHLPNPEGLIDRVRHALKPGGLFWVSDTNGEEALATVLAAATLTFILPTQISYAEKIRGLFHFGIHAPSRIKASMEGEGSSPFEGAGRQSDWPKFIRDRFKIEEHICHPAVTEYLAAEIKMPDPVALPLLRIIKAVDQTLVRCKILRNTGLTLYARKT